MNWALLDQAMVSAVNFATGLLLARFLGIEEFGYFTLLWMVVLFLNSIQMALIIAPMMSIAPKQEESDKASYYGAVLIKQIYFSFFSFLLVLVVGNIYHYYFPSHGINILVLPLAVVVVAVQMQDFIRRIFFSQHRAIYAFSSDVIRYLGQIFFLVWAFSTTTISIGDVLWIISSVSAVAIFVAIFTVKNLKILSYFPSVVIKRHWISSKWMVASALLQWLSGNLFFILAGVFLGAAAVGALKAAQNLLAILHIVFQGLENVVPAGASLRFHRHGLSDMYQYLKKMALLSFSVTALLALLMGVSAEFWLGFVFGQAYVEYSYVVQWWAVIYIVMSLLLPLRSAYRAVEKTKNIFISYVMAAAFAVSCGWILVQQWELVGVMIGLLITYLLMVCYLSISLRSVASRDIL